MFDSNARKGIIYQKLKYERSMARTDAKRPRLENHKENSTESFDSVAFTAISSALVAFFTKCELPSQMSKLKEKFEETVELRQKMISDLDKFHQLRELYLLFPDLVRLIKNKSEVVVHNVTLF